MVPEGIPPLSRGHTNNTTTATPITHQTYIQQAFNHFIGPQLTRSLQQHLGLQLAWCTCSLQHSMVQPSGCRRLRASVQPPVSSNSCQLHTDSQDPPVTRAHLPSHSRPNAHHRTTAVAAPTTARLRGRMDGGSHSVGQEPRCQPQYSMTGDMVA
jgi:hypothetical protein